MKLQNVVPETGQFIVMWEWDGVPWCRTARLLNGKVQEYVPSSEEWESLNAPSDTEVDFKYFTIDKHNTEKPPLGLIPEKHHKRLRSVDICQAMERYVQAGKVIPIEWISELKKLHCET